MRGEYIFAIAIITLIAAFILKGLNLYYNQAEPTIPNADWIGAVDYNNDGQVTKQSIKDGEDILIAAIPPDQENQQGQQLTHPRHLKQIDETRDDVLTVHDRQYNRLRALYVTPGGNTQLLRLNQLGIYGIKLDSTTDTPYHNVILGDSSTRPILPPPDFNTP